MADSQKLVLPLEYQEVEYIENTGTTQYIDTGWKRDFNKDIEIEAVIKLSTINKRYCIISDYSSQYQYNMSFEITGDNFGRVFINAANNLVGTHIYNSNEFNIFKYSYDHTTPSGTVEVNSGSDSKTYQTEVRRIAVDNARIFVDKDSRFSTFNYSFKLQKMRIKEDNVLVRNFIPCYRKSDNEAGLYDTVNDVFYTNQGTGSFTVGANVSSWQHSLRKLTTAADDITTFPATIYGVGEASTDWELEGNTVQNGTPSSSSPVEVNGVGERTSNNIIKIITNVNINSSGKIISPDNYTIAIAPITQDSAYSGNGWLYAYYDTEPSVNSVAYNNTRYSQDYLNQTAPITGYVALRVTDANSPMINDGSIKLPYEPYGYKIPIPNGQQTTNIYLGSTQSERIIDKLVLTGGENWEDRPNYTYADRFVLQSTTIPRTSTEICTHFTVEYSSQQTYPYLWINNGEQIIINYSAKGTTTLAQFKQWLADQYTNGTPVVIYYVLATATTGVVNEPLMKIGDYADSITQTQAGTAIQLSDGKSTLDINSDVKPSKLTLTYKGWHDASVKEWDGSAWS